MPALADIIVKKADGTTNITYTGVVPSAGDKTPAVWRSNSVGAAIGQRPEFRMVTSPNGDNSARRFVCNYSFPSLYTDTSTSRVNVAQRLNFTVSGVVPVDMPDTDISEAISQGFNLVASALVVSSAKAGYAPT
jgi:hypothetical protein